MRIFATSSFLSALCGNRFAARSPHAGIVYRSLPDRCILTHLDSGTIEFAGGSAVRFREIEGPVTRAIQSDFKKWYQRERCTDRNRACVEID